MHKVIFVPRRTGPHSTPPARTRGLEALAGDFTELYLDFCVTSTSVEVSASARVGELFRAVEVLREAKTAMMTSRTRWTSDCTSKSDTGAEAGIDLDVGLGLVQPTELEEQQGVT